MEDEQACDKTLRTDHKADKLEATIRKNPEALGFKGKSLLNEMAVMFNSEGMN